MRLRLPRRPVKPNARYIFTDVCSTESGADQIGKLALAESPEATFAVIHYRDVRGGRCMAVVHR